MSCEPLVFEPAAYTALAGLGPGEDATVSARTRGYAEGYAHGIRAAESAARNQRRELEARTIEAERARTRDHARAIAVLRTASEALERRTVPALDHASAVLAESALLLAEAILGVELSNAPSGARAALDRALSAGRDAEIHSIRMNPADLGLLDPAVGPAAGVKLVADAGLLPGDAISEFADGFLDSRISTALDRARTALLGGAT
ncbi:FliH/SctL family protein [Paeniglutamicibacter cryotolerans]|uniref:Flagellar assembly protein FliH n=1 Tax=Paeniglutamicibacter cryotolerans TaxID=670079 RepID=A0A839QIP7_9MICC|nr:FliH/SctL family protein [Paeniglutamicibacter cryotolerans]MBB2993896.1 flagellar assembly protein FliH [Paeniglutamicibacter cryotolerans]